MTYQRNRTRRASLLSRLLRLMSRCLFIKFNGSPCRQYHRYCVLPLSFPLSSLFRPSALLKPFAVKIVAALQTEARGIKKRSAPENVSLPFPFFTQSPPPRGERETDERPRRELGDGDGHVPRATYWALFSAVCALCAHRAREETYCRAD